MVVGLGNPGKNYLNTRHNVGFEFVDFIANQENCIWIEDKKSYSFRTQLHLKGKKIILAKPTTFMNQSGKSVTALMRNFKIFPTNIAVIHDDITLPVNRIKMSNHGSSGGHNGIDDILSRIGPKFTRIKIGIGNKIDKDQSLADYVLQKFTSSDDSILKNLKPEVFQGIKLLIDNGVEAAMNTINRRPKTL